MMIITREDYDRRKHLGGSDAAAALGLSPWKSPVELWQEKTGRIPVLGTPSEAMRWGTVLEDVVAKRYASETGLFVWNTSKVFLTDDSILAASIDRLVTGGHGIPAISKASLKTKHLLEVKTSRSKDGWGEQGTDDIPLHYQCQVYQYLGITGAEVCDLAVLFGGSEYAQYTIKHDTETWGIMEDALKKWWRDHVVADFAPSPRSANDVEKLFPGKVDHEAVASKEAEIAIKRMVQVKSGISKLEEEEARLKSQICIELGNNTKLIAPDGQPLVSWRSTKGRVKINWDGILNEIPNGKEVLAKHTVTGNPYRMFLIKIRGEDNGQK